jgi:hypothetical protein
MALRSPIIYWEKIEKQMIINPIKYDHFEIGFSKDSFFLKTELAS